MPASRLLAVSDLHVRYPENRAVVEGLRPAYDGDWLIVAGDVGRARRRRASAPWRCCASGSPPCVWVPGNHELWTRSKDPRRAARRGRATATSWRPAAALGVLTPEDPYPVWTGAGGPAVVAPLFLLYDYSFLPDGTATAGRGAGRRLPGRRGLHRRAPARARPVPRPRRLVRRARRVLAGPGSTRCDPDLPTVLVNHWPLTRLPTRVLRLPRVRAVVRHDGHRRLARPLPRRGRRLRPPAHPARDVGGRRAVRRGVAGLPARVAGPRRPGPAAADGAARAALSSRPSQWGVGGLHLWRRGHATET